MATPNKEIGTHKGAGNKLTMAGYQRYTSSYTRESRLRKKPKIEIRMAKKLIEWFFLDVLFALIPLILAMGFRWLADKPIVQAAENIPELAFTSVMLNIITIGDLGKAAETPVWDEVFRSAYYLMLFLAVISVAVLAAYLYGTIIGPENLSVTRHLLTASWCVTGACLVLTSLAEIAMNAVEKKPSRKKPSR